MLTLIEGSSCPEGSSAIVLEMGHAKIDHKVVPSDGNGSPRLLEDGDLVAEGTRACLAFVEQRRQRVAAKSGLSLAQNRIVATT